MVIVRSSFPYNKKDGNGAFPLRQGCGKRLYSLPVPYPRVSILLPVLNEADHIDDCLESLADQDFDGDLELIVAEGGSTDGSRDMLSAWQDQLTNLVLVDNPRRLQAHGLNLAAERATGEILVRVDAHTTYAPDYVRLCVEGLLESEAKVVGGLQSASARGPFGRAVAEAMGSRVAIGPAPFRHATEPTEADTVYLGAMKKSDWEHLDGWRSLPSGVAEDADLHFRLRSNGGQVLVDPAIRTIYRPRETPGALWRQFFRYGMGKADMLYINGRWPSLRPAAPLILVLGFLAGLVAGVIWSWWPLIGLVVVWLLTLVVAARGRLLVMVAAGIMQLAYGLGLLRGMLRWPPRVRASVE